MAGINNGTISDCYVYSANVIRFHSGRYYGGGLIAGLNNGMIKQCYAVGSLTFLIETSYDFGSGGLVGKHDRTAGAVTMNCWAAVDAPHMFDYGFGSFIGTVCPDGADLGVYRVGWVNDANNESYAMGLHTAGACGTRPTVSTAATYETGTIDTFCDPSHSVYTLTSPWSTDDWHWCGSSSPSLKKQFYVLFLSHPQDQDLDYGDEAYFSCSVLSGSTPTYQWRTNSTAIPSATSENYTIASVVDADANDYDVVVTYDGHAVTSDVATLTVTPTSITITDQPDDKFKAVGRTATFSVSVSTIPDGYTVDSVSYTHLTLPTNREV